MTIERGETYLYYRAEAELARAQQANHPAAVKAHYLMAGRYLDGFYGEAAASTPSANDG